jgi:hypothetical protein
MDLGPYWPSVGAENTMTHNRSSLATFAAGGFRRSEKSMSGKSGTGRGPLEAGWFVLAVGIWLIVKRVAPWPV